MRLFQASLEHTNWSPSKQKYEDPPQDLQDLKKQPMICFRDGYEKVVTLLMVKMSCRSEVDEEVQTTRGRCSCLVITLLTSTQPIFLDNRNPVFTLPYITWRDTFKHWLF
jgi:hypothetical protein